MKVYCHQLRQIVCLVSNQRPYLSIISTPWKLLVTHYQVTFNWLLVPYYVGVSFSTIENHTYNSIPQWTLNYICQCAIRFNRGPIKPLWAKPSGEVWSYGLRDEPDILLSSRIRAIFLSVALRMLTTQLLLHNMQHATNKTTATPYTTKFTNNYGYWWWL